MNLQRQIQEVGEIGVTKGNKPVDTIILCDIITLERTYIPCLFTVACKESPFHG